jgi:hypothetical protein
MIAIILTFLKKSSKHSSLFSELLIDVEIIMIVSIVNQFTLGITPSNMNVYITKFIWGCDGYNQSIIESLVKVIGGSIPVCVPVEWSRMDYLFFGYIIALLHEVFFVWRIAKFAFYLDDKNEN